MVLVKYLLVGTDSTHVKVNASRASEELVEMPETPGAYWERLDAYEEAALETLAEKDRAAAEEAYEADQAGQPAQPQAGEPDGPGGRAHEAARQPLLTQAVFLHLLHTICTKNA